MTASELKRELAQPPSPCSESGWRSKRATPR